MAVIASMSVSSNPAGNVLTLSDTSTGLGTVSARTFTVYNSLGDLVQVIDSPTSATADYAVAADAYWSFTLDVTDNTGTYQAVRNYLANGIYLSTYVNVIAQLGCGCNCGGEQLTYADISELYNTSALRLALGGFGNAANNAIVAANAIITGS